MNTAPNIQQLEMAAKNSSNPQEAIRAHQQLAQAYLREADTKRTPELLRKALYHLLEVEKLGISDLASWNNIGSCYAALNHPDKAIPYYEKIYAQQPDNYNLLLNLGMAYNDLLSPKARGVLKRAITLRPNEAPPYMHLGIHYAQFGKYEEALHYLDEAIRLNKGLFFAHLWKSNMLEKTNRIEEAWEAIESATCHSDGHQLALDGHKALLLLRSKKFEEAIEQYDKVIPRILNPFNRAQAYAYKANALDKLKRYDEAFTAYKAAQDTIAATPQYKQHDPKIYERFIQSHKDWLPKAAPSRWAYPQELGRQAPIFIVGFPRSGTTLMEQILSAHPELEGTQEKPTLSLLTNEMHHKHPYPMAINQIPAEDITRYRERYWVIAEQQLGTLPDQQIIDKLPLNIAQLGLIYRLFPDAKIIVCLRDPRDVVLSCFMQIFRPNSAMVHFNHLQSAAELYRDVMSLYLQYREYLPDIPLIEHRYEETITDMEGSARKLIAFVGKEWDDEVLQYREKNRFVSTPSYEAVLKPIYQTAAGRWHHYAEPMKSVLPVLAPFVEQFGYEVDA